MSYDTDSFYYIEQDKYAKTEQDTIPPYCPCVENPPCNDCPVRVHKFNSTLSELLGDVPLVASGVMSRQQCINYAQQYVELTTHTEQDKKELLKSLVQAINKYTQE